MYRQIVFVDPGQTTGWVLGRYVGVDGKDVGIKIVQMGQWKAEYDHEERGYFGIAERLWLLGVSGKGSVGVDMGVGAAPYVVIEDFVLLPGVGGRGFSAKREGISPVRIGSHIKGYWLAQGAGACVFVQQVSQAKGVATNDRLKRAGLWQVGFGGANGHACDAMRHALLWCKERKLTIGWSSLAERTGDS